MQYLYMPLLLLVASCGSTVENIGTIEDPSRNRLIPYQIWLPNADVDMVRLPLVLVSHGSGGEYSNHLWLIDSLIENGFVVVALNHPLNTTGDNTNDGIVRVWERPRDITLLLDYLLNESNWADIIDINRIGAAGFSSGGYTVLALAGAIYDPKLMSAYCASRASRTDCMLATDFHRIDYSKASASYKDTRINSVFSMAPAVGPAITQDSLNKITLPVFVIASTDDEVVNPKHSAKWYADNITNSDLFLIPSGGHFVFLECSVITHVVDWFNQQLDLCGTKFKADREEIRSLVSDKAVHFFAEHLAAISP